MSLVHFFLPWLIADEGEETWAVGGSAGLNTFLGNRTGIWGPLIRPGWKLRTKGSCVPRQAGSRCQMDSNGLKASGLSRPCGLRAGTDCGPALLLPLPRVNIPSSDRPSRPLLHTVPGPSAFLQGPGHAWQPWTIYGIPSTCELQRV